MPASSFFRRMMGNDNSLPSDLKFHDVIKVSDSWTQKSATLQKGCVRVCVFEQCLISENIELLQKLSKNLMLHRHPFILKYISSWKTNKKFYVATEYAEPLAHVVNDLFPMQLCIGLFNILKAVTFLQDQALSAHNNLNKDAIFVTSDECWKLGQLDLLSRRNVEECEKSNNVNSNFQSLFVDQRSFTVLANEILEGKTNDEIPFVTEFTELCKLYISAKNPNPQFLQQLFKHPFFTHQFISIYAFLIELPIKSECEKAEFFATVAEKLSSFPEELVARQLGTLLMSRLVLLNVTAQNYLLPKIFNPRDDDNLSTLFSEITIQKYIMPKLLNIFTLRDSQIRLIMLKYFSSFHRFFTKEQLQNKILPELLVGIKDTNEQLVAATLHTLADLVPILGASAVIGKGCTKLFADGRPLVKNDKKSTEEFVERSIQSDTASEIETEFIFAERPSPDGGEDSTTSSVNTSIEIETSVPTNEVNLGVIESTAPLKLTTVKPPSPIDVINEVMKPIALKPTKKKSLSMKYTPTLVTTEDLNTLDIKCSKSTNDDTEIHIEEMFKAMEPVISKTAIVKVNDENVNKFQVANVDCTDEGWGDDVNNWGDLEELVENE